VPLDEWPTRRIRPTASGDQSSAAYRVRPWRGATHGTNDREALPSAGAIWRRDIRTRGPACGQGPEAELSPCSNPTTAEGPDACLELGAHGARRRAPLARCSVMKDRAWRVRPEPIPDPAVDKCAGPGPAPGPSADQVIGSIGYAARQGRGPVGLLKDGGGRGPGRCAGPGQHRQPGRRRGPERLTGAGGRLNRRSARAYPMPGPLPTASRGEAPRDYDR
jgi:hypothetical protein